MGFKAGKVRAPSGSINNGFTQINLNKQELGILLQAIRESTFKGEILDVLYNLTLKLQKEFIGLKDEK